MIDPNKDNAEKLSELKAVYKLAIETRNFEIHQLINRNNFFMLFQGEVYYLQQFLIIKLASLS